MANAVAWPALLATWPRASTCAWPRTMWAMWAMPMQSHGLRYRPPATGHHVGHVGHANRIRVPALTVRPCIACKMRRLCAVGHVGTQNNVFKSLYPIL